MTTPDSKVIPAPPSLVKAFRSGFDAVANHVELLLLPLALDLFLWFGPHLSLYQLVSSVYRTIQSTPGMDQVEMQEMVKMSEQLWLEMTKEYNMFSLLRTLPVGIPSLLSGSPSTAQTPLGLAQVWQVPSGWVAFAAWGALLLVGLVIGAFYFNLVRQAALDGQVSWRGALAAWPVQALQTLVLAVGWLVVFLMFTIPFSCVLSFVVFSGLSVGRLAMLLFTGLLAWIFVPLAFSPHGVFTGQPAWQAVRTSALLARRSLPTTALFLVIALVASEGLDLLWHTPPETSWLMLISLGGHAFVTTGLLAASFVYYRDALHWVEKMLVLARWNTSSQMPKA